MTELQMLAGVASWNRFGTSYRLRLIRGGLDILDILVSCGLITRHRIVVFRRCRELKSFEPSYQLILIVFNPALTMARV